MSSATHPDPKTPGSSPSGARSAGRSRTLSPLLILAGIAGVVLVGIAAFWLLRFTTRDPYSGPVWTVEKQKLKVTIIERGTLESAENSEIICRVKAKSQGSTIASTIKWVIDDGTEVKAGDPLIDLDDSGFQENVKNQKNAVAEKYAKWIEAKTNCTFQEIENESLLETSKVNLIQMDLELKKYTGNVAGEKMVKFEGRDQMRKYLVTDFESDVSQESSKASSSFTSAYLAEVSDYKGKIETARSDVEAWLDRAAWSQRMVRKGLYTPSQADSDQSRLQSAEITLRKVTGDLDIYRKFELEKNVTKKWSDYKEAERDLKKKKIQADSKMEKAKADEVSARAIYDQESDRLRDMLREEKYYRITAPQDGMVVYFMPEQSRTGGGTQQSIIAQGEPVREGQKLIRIPNLAKMLVNVRVHEAMVSKLHGSETRSTGFTDKLRAGASFGLYPDLLGLSAFQIAFEDLRDEFKEYDHVTTYDGQKAYIRIDAHPGKQYSGRVKTVATVASSGDFFSSDIKVYPTMVSITSDVENETLRPGMSAEVTILADETDDKVLVIPIQAVVGNLSMGAKRKCYVLDAKDIPQEREIEVGKSNDKVVEVRSGLQEGEKVVQNPRSLIPENSGMKTGTPGTRRGAEVGEDGGGPGKKGKKGGKKGADVQPLQPQIPPDTKSFQRPENVPPPVLDRVPGKKQ